MLDLRIRCSALGKIMGEPRSKSDGPLTQSAKTYIRELASQEIFGVDFEVSSKAIEKGIECEQDSIDLFNRVFGRDLKKNDERRTDDFLTGESDLPDVDEVVDIKTPWSIATFPLCRDDVTDAVLRLYDWQLVGYMRLWNKPRARLAYCLVDTPERLIGYEPIQLHAVSHIPPHLRVTSWVMHRDAAKEALMIEKIKAARAYYAEVLAEFDASHRPLELA